DSLHDPDRPSGILPWRTVTPAPACADSAPTEEELVSGMSSWLPDESRASSNRPGWRTTARVSGRGWGLPASAGSTVSAEAPGSRVAEGRRIAMRRILDTGRVGHAGTQVAQMMLGRRDAPRTQRDDPQPDRAAGRRNDGQPAQDGAAQRA